MPSRNNKKSKGDELKNGDKRSKTPKHQTAADSSRIDGFRGHGSHDIPDDSLGFHMDGVTRDDVQAANNHQKSGTATLVNGSVCSRAPNFGSAEYQHGGLASQYTKTRQYDKLISSPDNVGGAFTNGAGNHMAFGSACGKSEMYHGDGHPAFCKHGSRLEYCWLECSVDFPSQH